MSLPGTSELLEKFLLDQHPSLTAGEPLTFRVIAWPDGDVELFVGPEGQEWSATPSAIVELSRAFADLASARSLLDSLGGPLGGE